MDARIDRRRFLASTGRGIVAVAALSVAERLHAQTTGTESGGAQSPASNVEMTAESYKPVSRPPKPNATPQLDEKQLDAFERNLACPCPCTLDVYTCRTTDFQCGISPAVHGDIKALVAGGYSGDEIMAAMLDTYGDFILMTPRKQGFNLLAWFAPFAALGVGAIGIGALLRSWRRNAAVAQARRDAQAAASPHEQTDNLDATPDELARLEAAVRDESR